MMSGIILRNGVVLPSIGLGTYKATGEQLVDAVKCAYQTGIRHIDTALGYKVTFISNNKTHVLIERRVRF